MLKKQAGIPLKPPVRPSVREMRRFKLLVILAVGMLVMLAGSYRYWHPCSSRPGSPSARSAAPSISTSPRAAASKRPVVPFVPDPQILKTIEDDRYLHTRPYYYLVHMALALTPQQIDKRVEPQLGWQDIRKRRSAIRGHWFQVQGELVRLLVKDYGEDTRARAHGFQRLWHGAIYTDQGHLYLFVITDFPAQVRRGDQVLLQGAFFKVWFFTSKTGTRSNAPVLIGKTLQLVKVPPNNGWWYLGIVFGALVLLSCGLLGYALWHEQREARRYHQAYRRRSAKGSQEAPPEEATQ